VGVLTAPPAVFVDVDDAAERLLLEGALVEAEFIGSTSVFSTIDTEGIQVINPTVSVVFTAHQSKLSHPSPERGSRSPVDKYNNAVAQFATVPHNQPFPQAHSLKNQTGD
jgi:hypothetical protein